MTDEERREVARKLRSEKCAQVVWVSAVRLAIGVDGETDGNDILDRLADLIEPLPERTCKPVVEECVYQWGGVQYEIKCDKCGDAFVRTFSDKEFVYDLAENLPSNGIRFCSRCGAKVVE